MKARVEAGTDVAMVGLWDARLNSMPFRPAETTQVSSTLEKETEDGRLFLIHTGSDGGGPVDLYIDEEIPAEIQARLRPVEGAFLLAVPSGKLLVGGAEDYRAEKTKITGQNSIVAVHSGDYAVRCYTPMDEAQPARSEEALRDLVGGAELAYYDRTNRKGCMRSMLTFLLFPVLIYPLGWKLALPATVVAFIASFHLREWMLKRNPRYQHLHDIVPAFRLQHEVPMLVFHLRTLKDRAGLKGGSVSL